MPDAAVELAIGGVAREPIDSGEVVLTLPTKALMDHVGEGRQDLPAEARWACGDDDLTEAPIVARRLEAAHGQKPKIEGHIAAPSLT